MSTNLAIWDNPLANGDLLCEQEIVNSHDPQTMAIKRWLMICQLQVVGHVPKKYLPINLFDICVKLYRCVNIWMVKIWRIFGRSSISPNFPSIRYLYDFTIHYIWEAAYHLIWNVKPLYIRKSIYHFIQTYLPGYCDFW